MSPDLRQALIVLGIIGILYSIYTLLRWFLRRRARTKQEALLATMTIVFVNIPDSIMPTERGEKYQNPLDEALRSKDLGQLVGAGTELGEPDAEGHRLILSVGLDIALSDMERGLPFLKSELLRLGAPNETTLEYMRAGEKITESVKI